MDKSYKIQPRNSRYGLLEDTKFRWLIASVLVVVFFEILSLSGAELHGWFAGLFFAAIIVAVGHETLLGGIRALLKLNFSSIKLLMLIAVVGAFYLGEYVEAAVVIVLFSLGERLEAYGIEASKSSLEALLESAPKRANIKRDGLEVTVPIAELEPGDTVILRPADLVPADAEVVSGNSSVDEATITGEPIPADKAPGDPLFAGTTNLQGYLEARVTKPASDSTLAKIVETTFQATKEKAKTQRFIEKFSKRYTPAVIVLAILLVVVPVFLLGMPFQPWLLEALTLLVIACPCALVISTPISIYSAVGAASKKGILIKGGKAIEAAANLKAIGIDKTRTLTYGKPLVTDVVPFGKITREELLGCVGGIEIHSEHPFARAITDAARTEGIKLHEAKNFEAVTGKGVRANCVVCYDSHYCIGKLPFVSEEHNVRDEVISIVDRLNGQGKSSIIASSDTEVKGIIALEDELKAESIEAVNALKSIGVIPVMLTGDNRAPAAHIGKKLGITDVRAELLPEEKSREIKKLIEEYGAVGMVGDGVNDAPALAASSLGISMGAAGSDTAIEISDVAILNDKLLLISFLIRLGRKTVSTIRFNTALAIVTKLVVVLLAIFGLGTLPLAIFADVGITIIVILISLRLMNFGRETS
ncbi:MAG: heavy metal translocating P-type ATPase [Pyrinomonadaceae bacterium]